MTLALSTHDEMQSVDAAQLKVGTRLRIPIYDENDVLLLAVGQIIEPNFMGKLKNRGIDRVKVHESELERVLAGKPQGRSTTVPQSHAGVVCPEANSGTGLLDRIISQGGGLGLPQQGEPFAKQVRSSDVRSYDAGLESEIIDNHVQTVDQLQSIYESLSGGQTLDVEGSASVPEVALSYMAEDPDLYACLGINPLAGTYPARHGVHTQMLAVSIGLNMGLDRQTLRELAIGCLIHDSGMLKIDKEIYDRPTPLSPVEFLEITKHPIRVFDSVREISAVPNRSAFIAYQIHERCNGQGYPRRRKGNQIHFLAKIASIADAYIALVAPRPYRDGILPYKAMESIIYGVKQGLFDPNTVRALLRTTSLFPLGSFVELTDGRVGRVLRANGDNFSNPIVEAWSPGLLLHPPQLVDLSQEQDVKIKRPLAELPRMASQVRDQEW